MRYKQSASCGLFSLCKRVTAGYERYVELISAAKENGSREKELGDGCEAAVPGFQEGENLWKNYYLLQNQ